MLRQQPLGDPIYFVVPKQETFSVERELTCASGIDGFCRAKVVSFELLGEDVLAECGGTAVPQVTPIGRQMIIGHLLRRHEAELVYYRSSARQVGLAAELDATFAEFERCGKSIADVVQLINELQDAGSAPSLARKLTDLRLLYEQYLSYLGSERLDPHRRLEQVLENIRGCKRLRGATLFVDGFIELHDWQRRMLGGLATVCREIEITVLLDPSSEILRNPHHVPEEMSLFRRTEELYRRLWFTFNEMEAPVEPPLRLTSTRRYQSAALSQLERHFEKPSPPPIDAAGAVEFIEAPDRRAEVDAAARQVRKLLDQGLRLREITVLMRSIGDYQDLIGASFIEHGIDYFVDRRRTAAHHPLIQFVRALLQIALHNWPHESVIALLKTQLAGISLSDADALENYVLEHRIHGSAWASDEPWAYQRRLLGREDRDRPRRKWQAEQMDAMRTILKQGMAPLLALLADPSRTVTIREMVVALMEVLNRFNVRRTIAEWVEAAVAAGELERKEEHEQVWSEFVELLDQLVDVIGAEAVSAADFEAILETGLEQFDLALTPPTVDQVIVGPVDRTRSSRPRAVVLLGMNDGQFPHMPREASILSDNERRTLQQHRVELDSDAKRALFDERFFGYLALSRASQHLCLTRAMAEDAMHPQSASVFWERVRLQFPEAALAQIPRDANTRMDCIGTPRQVVTALMQWARGNSEGKTDDAWASLYQWLATHECCSDAIDTMRYRAWKALSYCNAAALSPETVKRLFRSPLTTSVSRLETFSTCSFKHFAQYGLGLEQREEEDVTAIDLGIVCHSILEKMVRQMLPSKRVWDSIPAEKAQTMIRELAQEIGQELRGEVMLSSARNQHMLSHIEKTIAQVIDAQAAAGKRGRMAPWRVELEFGEGKPLGPLKLETPAGNTLLIRGKIDRVDKVQDGAAFAVIDYKYRGDSLSLDRVYHGLSLQLLTYLLVLQRGGAGKLTPAGAFYVKLLRQLEKIDHPSDATAVDDPLFHLKVKPRGLINWNHRELFDADHQSKASDVVSLYVKNDGTLGNKNNSDGCESVEFDAMLKLVERKLSAVADGIMGGTIDVKPYRIGDASPCVYCEYRSVCRFDPAINAYNHLPAMKREEVLQRVIEEPGEPQQ
jgi:ATP-dependent helicase/nuclease subunit B